MTMTPPLAVTLIAALVLGGCALPQLPDRIEIPENDASFRTRVYAGATMGNSHLTPDTRGTVFTRDDGDDLGTQLRLGVDVHNMLSVELETAVLGTAELREAGTDVNYSAASISALVYGLNGVQLRSRREGWSAYGRFGYGILKKSSAVIALEESGTVPVIGAGAEYGFPNGLGVRGEITRFDEDAIYLGLGAVYRFGLTPREVGGLIAEVAAPVLASEDVPVADGGRVLKRSGRLDDFAPPELGAARPRPIHTARTSGPWRPGARADDRDRDGVRDAEDRCPDTAANVAVDPIGCGLFDTVLVDVSFKSGSSWLTARARGALDQLAERLLAFPEVRVRVLAHTDSTGSADFNLGLSARRAEAVVQYLESLRVGELQLEAQGLGEARPLASNRDAKGRALNRRVELETLASLGAEALASAALADDRREPVRWLPPEPVAAPKPDEAPAVAAAVAAMGGSRPAPLPASLLVPGLAIAGVISDVRFVTGSAELLPEGLPELARIAGELRSFPTVRVSIMAHTDDQGTEKDNLALSEKRARSVLEHFVDLGIERTRLEAHGYGESLPLVQNVTADDRARNRRVELRLIR